MRRRILTLTLNPTLDLDTSVDQVIPGPKLRCDPPLIDPGGGGINVSRAIRILGGRSLAHVVAGGPTGATLESLLRAEGVAASVIDGPGATRESLSVTDRGSGAQYRFVLPGPQWRRRDAEAVLDRLEGAAGDGDILVMSGSQPPGVAADLPLRLARRLGASGACLALDTSGAALHRAVEKPGRRPLWLLRMDDGEAEELAGRPLPRPEDSAAFARLLVGRGVAHTVIVARGADGSVAATAAECLHVVPPAVEVVSKVGAGDSFTAAFVLAVVRGAGLERALRMGVAAAASAVTTVATRLCHRDQVRRLAPLCRLARV